MYLHAIDQRRTRETRPKNDRKIVDAHLRHTDHANEWDEFETNFKKIKLRKNNLSWRKYSFKNRTIKHNTNMYVLENEHMKKKTISFSFLLNLCDWYRANVPTFRRLSFDHSSPTPSSSCVFLIRLLNITTTMMNIQILTSYWSWGRIGDANDRNHFF